LLWLTGCLVSHVLPDAPILLALLTCAAGVGLIGFTDDQTPTTPMSRILILLVFLGVAYAIAPELIAPSLNWGSFEPTPITPWAFCALLGLGTVGIVNAVNMADGQNGLVSGMFVIWSACLMLIGDDTILAIAEILCAVCLVAFAFNLCGKLFLGNCGSYGVTFVLGILIMLTHARGRMSVETATVWFFIPVADCLRLMITRLARGRSPASADRDHFHHRLQDALGHNHGLLAYLSLVGATSFIASLSPRFSLVCITILTAVYFSFASVTDSSASRARKAPDPEIGADSQPVASPATVKIVPMKHSERTVRREEAQGQ